MACIPNFKVLSLFDGFTKGKLFAVTLLILCSLAVAYTTSMFAPAVLENENVGVLTAISLNVTPGTGNVVISGPSAVGSSTLQSAQQAVSYATSYLNVNKALYNFNYSFLNSSNVSGPSGGLALTLLAVSGIEHKQLARNFTVTGTIGADGSVGLVGGVYDKVAAAKNGSERYILVPYSPNTSLESLIYYVSQQSFNIPVVPVSNISQALQFAFGSPTAVPLSINLTVNYHANLLSNYTPSCTGCNLSAFSQLVNSTFSFAQGIEENISGNLGSSKQSLLNNLQQYNQIASKGYLYTAADLAFLDAISAYTLQNSQNLTLDSTQSLIDNASFYCSSIVPPQMTNTNYEYVAGGKLRQLWANITIQDAQKTLNASQTTDDYIQTAYVLAPAIAWCNGASSMYSIAYSLGGNSVIVSSAIKQKAAALMANASKFGSGLYYQSAQRAYSSGDYATALYAATYANAFGQPIPAATNAELMNITAADLANSTTGIWPSQFAAQSVFYSNEASFTANASSMKNYLTQAYTTSLLAKDLSYANSALQNTFAVLNVTPNTSSPVLSSQLANALNSLESSVTQVYAVLLVESVLLLVVLMTLIVLVLQNRPKAATDIKNMTQHQRIRTRRRKRRS